MSAVAIEITERVPIEIDSNPENVRYLQTKRDRMGHRLPETITSAPVLSSLDGTTP